MCKKIMANHKNFLAIDRQIIGNHRKCKKSYKNKSRKRLGPQHGLVKFRKHMKFILVLPSEVARALLGPTRERSDDDYSA